MRGLNSIKHGIYFKMIEVIFDYNHIKTVFWANLNNSFYNLVRKYINKTHIDLNKIQFSANGKNINPKEKVENLMNKWDKLNKRIIVISIIILIW